MLNKLFLIHQMVDSLDFLQNFARQKQEIPYLIERLLIELRGK